MDILNNPRGSEGLVRVGIIAAGSFALYRFAQSGGLGPTAKSLADSLWGAAANTQIPINVSAGGGRVTVTGPTPAATPGRCPDFIAGVQYVADKGNGYFETVIGGHPVFTGTQAEAEARYRAAFGC